MQKLSWNQRKRVLKFYELKYIRAKLNSGTNCEVFMIPYFINEKKCNRLLRVDCLVRNGTSSGDVFFPGAFFNINVGLSAIFVNLN